MLFHVTHTHDYQTCMAHREDARKEFNDGCIEAADYHDVDKALEPILKFGNYDIMPFSAM